MTMIKWRNKEVEKKVGDVHEEGVYFDKAVIDWKRNTCEVAGQREKEKSVASGGMKKTRKMNQKKWGSRISVAEIML